MAKRVGNKQLVFRTQRGLSWCCSLVFFRGKTTTTKQHQQKQQLKKQQKKSYYESQEGSSDFRLPTSNFRLPPSDNKTKKLTFVPIVTVLARGILYVFVCLNWNRGNVWKGTRKRKTCARFNFPRLRAAFHKVDFHCRVMFTCVRT